MRPKLYVENSAQTIADFKDILSTYSKMLPLRKYKKIIDVGCGPGNLTAELAKSYLSKDLVKLVGVDVCEDVIEYARNNYGPDSKIDFRQLDITTKEIPQNLRNKFDLVTSFYCLQVIADFKKALQNMCAMVKPGGDLFIYFMGECFPLDIWNYLGETARWKPYMKNYKKIMCPIHFSKNRVQIVEDILKESGYIVHLCTEQNYRKVYNKESITEFFKSMSYFDIPKDMENDFMLDHLEYFRRCNLNFWGENREENFIYNYTLIIIYATKQL